VTGDSPLNKRETHRREFRANHFVPFATPRAGRDRTTRYAPLVRISNQ